MTRWRTCYVESKLSAGKVRAVLCDVSPLTTFHTSVRYNPLIQNNPGSTTAQHIFYRCAFWSVAEWCAPSGLTHPSARWTAHPGVYVVPGDIRLPQILLNCIRPPCPTKSSSRGFCRVRWNAIAIMCWAYDNHHQMENKSRRKILTRKQLKLSASQIWN